MHILLTDTLTCPRCGPEFGLIVMADVMEERRVLEGRLGCANCRASYPIAAGVVDLVAGQAGEAGEAGSAGGAAPGRGAGEGAAAAEEAAYRLAALLGVPEGAGTLLLAGVDPETAAALAGLLPHVQVAAAAPPGAGEPPRGPSWLRLAAGFPFRGGTVRGVAMGAGAAVPLEEAGRVLARGGRLVLDPAPSGAAERLRELDWRILLEESGVVVASPPDGG